MQKTIASVWLLLLLGLNWIPKFSFGQGNHKPQEPVQNFSKTGGAGLDSFMVGIFYGPVLEFTNDEQYRIIKEANIDLIQNLGDPNTGLYAERSNKKMLSLANKYGLKVLVCDPRVFGSDDDIEDMVNTYKNEPALAGYNVKDEPFIPGLEDCAATCKKIAMLDPDKIVHVNLNSIDGFSNYQHDYVEAWVEKAGPENLSYISVDAYPFACDDKFLDTSFYKTLDVIRRVGLKYDVKTSAYLQSIGFSYKGRCNRRRPGVGELRQNVYTTLAYGIKHPVWFTYWQPRSQGPEHEKFTEAIIDSNGNKTDLYIPFQQLNREMKQLGRTLINLDAKDVYHTHPRIPPGMSAVPTDYLVPLPPDFVIQPEDKSADLIITNFIHRKTGDRYVMIVNKSYKEEKILSFRVNISVKKLQQISEITGEAVAVAVDKKNRSIQETFLPGQGKLFLLK